MKLWGSAARDGVQGQRASVHMGRVAPLPMARGDITFALSGLWIARIHGGDLRPMPTFGLPAKPLDHRQSRIWQRRTAHCPAVIVPNIDPGKPRASTAQPGSTSAYLG